MTRETQATTLDQIVELISENGTQEMAQTMTELLNLAMRFERDDFLKAGPYERTAERRGPANGYKPKTVRTMLGPLTFRVIQA